MSMIATSKGRRMSLHAVLCYCVIAMGGKAEAADLLDCSRRHLNRLLKKRDPPIDVVIRAVRLAGGSVHLDLP